MNVFTCPHCHSTTHIFGKDGVSKLSQHHQITLLGEVPLDPEVVMKSDEGIPVVISSPDSQTSQVYRQMAGQLMDKLRQQ
jgi:ATP-binding protein involved in chromosome partitioning